MYTRESMQMYVLLLTTITKQHNYYHQQQQPTTTTYQPTTSPHQLAYLASCVCQPLASKGTNQHMFTKVLFPELPHQDLCTLVNPLDYHHLATTTP